MGTPGMGFEDRFCPSHMTFTGKTCSWEQNVYLGSFPFMCMLRDCLRIKIGVKTIAKDSTFYQT